MRQLIANPPGTKLFNKSLFRHTRKGIEEEDVFCKEYPLLFREKIYSRWFGLKDFAGYKVSWSIKYQAFGELPLACQWCGIEANCLVLMQETAKLPTNRATFRLFCKSHQWGDYRYIPLTFDHILPRSLQGKNCLENYQILCKKCNNSKGNDPHKKYSYEEVQGNTRCWMQRLERETIALAKLMKELNRG